MPEPPDFKQIALTIARPYAAAEDEDFEGGIIGVSPDEDDLAKDIAEQLRQVWNARGAADVAYVESLEEALIHVWEYLPSESACPDCRLVKDLAWALTVAKAKRLDGRSQARGLIPAIADPQ